MRYNTLFYIRVRRLSYSHSCHICYNYIRKALQNQYIRRRYSDFGKTKTAEEKTSAVTCGWGGRIRTFGMTESESVALPLGDTPMFVRFSLFLVGIDGFEPSEWRSQSPLPYLLAISHRHVPHSNSLIIIAHHFEKCNTFSRLFTKHLHYINIYGQNDVKPYYFVEKLLKMIKICDKMTIGAWLGIKIERS